MIRGSPATQSAAAFTRYGIVPDDVFVAGDVARFPHPLFDYQMLSLEHWGNAVTQAQVAAHNMVSPGPLRRPHRAVPVFWSSQFGLNIKSVGVPTFSGQVVIAQGSLTERRLAAVYGYRGRITAAVTINMAKWLEHYQGLIETAAQFPPGPGAADGHPLVAEFPVPSNVPDPKGLFHGPTVALTGHLPDHRLTRGAAPPVDPLCPFPSTRSPRMAVDTLLERITDYADRPDLYPLFAELREAGVARQRDGSYLIGTYSDIVALLHDSRISADPRNLAAPYRGLAEEEQQISFIRLDDPEHQRLRSLAMRPFGPPHSPGRIDAMRGEIARITEELIEAFHGRTRIDIVEDFAYPLPVTVICRLLGVPRQDEPAFREWSAMIIDSVDIKPGEDPTERQRVGDRARAEMGRYLVDLAEQRRGHPSDDMLSTFVNDKDPAGRLTREELAPTL